MHSTFKMMNSVFKCSRSRPLDGTFLVPALDTLPTQKMMNVASLNMMHFVSKMMKFASKMMNLALNMRKLALKMMNFASTMMNFVSKMAAGYYEEDEKDFCTIVSIQLTFSTK